MDQRLMVTLDIDKEGQKFIFSVPQHAPFKLALESLHEFQGQILAWQKIAEDRQNATEAATPDQQIKEM
jgi:hypothetical protein